MSYKNSDEDIKTKLLLNARNNLMKMMKYRGYDTSNIPIISEKELQILEELNSKKNLDPFDLNFSNKNNDIVNVKFIFKVLNEKKIDEYIKNFFEDKEDIPKYTLILVIMNNDIENILQNKAYQLYQTYKYFTQVFFIDVLQQNIIDHSFVPKHILVPKEKENAVLEKYGIDSKRKLPYITKYDPVAKYIGMKPGDLCKIIRKSCTAGEYIAYRYCV